ncbi:Outer membrane lipoprotein-sorting protein [Mariprofundus aestuarium]|uniref:Outer membrane lipoprotein-sorting protein n=1 Tax=Mariprofundus aestuarium TaxID=1921086 RepID=A0A2K8KX25_MARES|nr:outer-membrane lipoprotein carrier protein LolA [Mariprofundus aestuarium]ATX79448.1 Outer membrane lipoprotein-sorting protein [Mariprofundus aestuarium]
MKQLTPSSLVIFSFALFMFISPLHAAELKPVEQTNGHEQSSDDFFTSSINRLSGLPGFQCQFDQLMVFSDGGSQHFSGEVAVLKPKRFRWSYHQPYEQLYVGDGSVIWHYEPDLLQAERLNDLDQVDPAVMKLLDGRVSVKDVEILNQKQDSELETSHYQVRIGDSAAVWLGFNKLGDLIAIERKDMLGNSNRMQLSECSYIAPSVNLFSFAPPEGVDLLDLRTANSE